MADQPPLPRITRIQPFSGLVIDQDTWAVAHDYHRQHQQLHLLAMHGTGIVRGLRVRPTDPASGTVIVEAGVAINDQGSVIIVQEAQRVSLEPVDGVAFVTLEYVESLGTTGLNSGVETRGRVVEDFRVRAAREPAESSALELARVAVAGGDLAVVDPESPWAPASNEIDSRFRSVLLAGDLGSLTVGLVVCGSDEEFSGAHVKGFFHLVRECASEGLRASAVVAAPNEVPDADLLYVTGRGDAKPSQALLTELAKRALTGSWLFADSCGDGEGLLNELRGAIGQQSADAVARTESFALAAHHVFGAAPPGARDSGELGWGANALLSSRDYGCAWSGQSGDGPLPRERIRDALEFGVNIGVSASSAAPASR